MNDELFNSEIIDKEYFVLSMIKQYIEDHCYENIEIVKTLTKYEKSLETSYNIFKSINLEQVLNKVFKYFFIVF